MANVFVFRGSGDDGAKANHRMLTPPTQETWLLEVGTSRSRYLTSWYLGGSGHKLQMTLRRGLDYLVLDGGLIVASQRRERGARRHNRGRNESGCLQQCVSGLWFTLSLGVRSFSECGPQRFRNSLEVSATVRSLR